MASLTDLLGFDPNAAPPALNIANLGLLGDAAMADTGLKEGIIGQNLQWDLRDIVNQRAARGGFRSGQTTVDLGRRSQIANQQIAQGRYDLQKQLLEIARNRFLTTVGMPMTGYFGGG